MPKIKFKNRNRSAGAKIRLIEADGTVITIGSQAGAVVKYDNVVDICLTKNTEILCDGATNNTGFIEFEDGKLYDIYIEDQDTPVHTQISASEFYELYKDGLNGLRVSKMPDIIIKYADASVDNFYITGAATLAIMYPDVDFADDKSASYLAWEAKAKTAVEMTVNRGVTSIDGDFWLFENLTKLTLNGGGAIGENTFGYHGMLDEVYIGPYVTSLGDYSFVASSISKITFAEGIQSIGAQALAYLYNANDLVLPDSLSTLGVQACDGWSNPKKLSIGGNLKIIRGDEFGGWGSSGANELILREGVERVGTESEFVFQNWKCTSLTLPNSLVYAGINSFVNWPLATSLTIGSGSLDINNYAFSNWIAATSLNLGGAAVIRPYAFENWTAYVNPLVIPGTATQIYDAAFVNWEECTGLTIQEGVLDVGADSGDSFAQGAFVNWYKAEFLHIADSVTHTRASFINWYKCADLHIGAGLTVLGTSNQGEFVNLGRDVADFDIVIPDTVTTINNILGGTVPRNITVGSGVTYIDSLAYQATNLYMRGTVPPTITNNAMPGPNPNLTVYVPDVAVYQADNDWASLYDIQTSAERFTLFEQWIPV